MKLFSIAALLFACGVMVVAGFGFEPSSTTIAAGWLTMGVGFASMVGALLLYGTRRHRQLPGYGFSRAVSGRAGERPDHQRNPASATSAERQNAA